MFEFKEIIKGFFEHIKKEDIKIYNEASLQYELGCYFRFNFLNLKVEFERNINHFNVSAKTIKKEIDLVVYDDKKKYAIELKYPRNGQYPEQMFMFIKDIKFMEEVKELGFDKAFALVLVDDPLFYSGNVPQKIYEYFRVGKTIEKAIKKPTGKKDELIILKGTYTIKWNSLSNNSKYFLLEI